MAEPISIQQLKDASLDVKSLEEVVNGDENVVVTTRLGETYPSVKGSIKKVFETGGLPATPFETKALMEASALIDGDYAIVTNDSVADDNSLYVKTAGNWVKSAYDPLTQAKDYVDTNKLDYKQISYSYEGGNLIGASSSRYDDFGITSALVLSVGPAYKSVVITVREGNELFIHNDKNSFSGTTGAKYAFFALDPFLNQSQTAITASATSISDGGVSYQKTTVPVGANYLILNTKHGANEYIWAVHKDALNPSFESGEAFVSAINGVELPAGVTFDSLEASVFADGVLNTATQNAKVYADENKLDYSQIEVAYRDGNFIGARTERHENFGLASAYAISSTMYYDGVIVPVAAGDLIYLHNNTNMFRGAEGTNYAFFSENPFINREQSRIVEKYTTITDAESSIVYREMVVPDGANYLLVNSRYTTSGGVRSDFEWAVNKDIFRPSYTAGKEYIYRILGATTSATDNFKLTQYKPSSKNIYKGLLQTKVRLVATVVQATTSENDVISPYIPVEYGKYYTISGLNPSALRPVYTLVHGTSANFAQSHVKTLATDFAEGAITVYIDNPDIKYIVFSLTGAEFSSYQEAKEMLVQVEEGQVATRYEPSVTSDLTNILMRLIGTGGTTPTPNTSGSKIITQFAQLDKVRDPLYTSLAPVSKDVGPLGITYSLASSEDSAANNLYAKHDVTHTGTKSIYAHVMKRVGDIKTVGELKSTAFTVPSGSLDNPDGYDYADKYPNYLTVHPSMAYTDTAIGGFKYWMVSSTFPPTTQGGVLWEDEDLFVSNDAKDWQRVRSMYETDKSYTTTTLRLPPQTIVTTGSRKNAFLPVPIAGSVFEVSVPADNGGPAVERQNYTVSATNLPWKHDPYLLIDGGYVYVYHSFNIRFNEHSDKKSHFFVCVRTNNGIDWDFVRSDGSTLRITESTSKQVFTKGADGKYNYLNYAYGNSRSSPEIVKFGATDYVLFYGRNFTERFQGTSPYSFDFTSPAVVKDLSNMNHPTLILQNGVLYNLSNYWVHSSTDRGTTWTKLEHYPLWRGGVSGFNYRKSSCIGEGGKFIVADVNRASAQAYEVNTRSVTNDINTMNIYEYPSFADFLSKANNGLVDAYIDMQLVKVNIDRKTRQVITIPNISLANAATSGNSALQRLKVADIDLVAGDTIHLYVTLNSRNGAQISFGGFDIM